MANLTPLITTIREAKKGRDVREAIAGTMEAINTDNIAILNAVEGVDLDALQEAASTVTAKVIEANTAANTAITKATEATNAATTATTAKDIAVTKATEATTAATTANDSAVTILSKVTEANNAAATATTKATEASTSATVATTKATEASTSATVATTKATEATTASTVATTKATEATNAALTAVDAKDVATTKATEATTASTVATTKATEATNATLTAVDAKDVATTKATEAQTSATNASNSANDAEASSTSALASMNTAVLKASEASDSADAAAASAALAGEIAGVTPETIAYWNAKQEPIGFTPENISNKGIPDGYASLGSDGKVPSAQLPTMDGHTHVNKAVLDKITTGTAVSYDLDSFGDMKKSVYDSTGNGIVDDAEKVNGLTVQTAVPLNAIFTDTVYTPPSTYSADIITDGTTNKVFTATLKTKLDSVEAGATADQTAEEILTSIKSVDGTGSGLDADLLDGKHANEFAVASHGTHVTYGDATTALVSGATGVIGTSTDLAREDHTHSLPAYPDLSGHVSSAGLHTTTEKQTEWNKNTTDIVLLQQQSGTLGANDSAVRREVIDIKLKLDEMNVVEYLNKTGIGFFDLFEDSSNIDAGSTTAVMASTDVTFTGTQILQMNSQNFSGFTNVELAIYDLLREQFLVTVAVSNSPTISMNMTPGSRTIGEKFYYNGEVYTITNIVAS